MHGQRIPCLALFLLAIAACGEERRPAHQPKPASDIPEPRNVTKRWQVVRVGTLLKFEAERTLYERAGSEHFFVSLDGQLIATDGKAFENLTLAWNDDDEDRPSSVIIPSPFPWGSVPEGAVVVVSP